MSWLYSLVIAGLMFSNDGVFDGGKQHTYTNTNVSQMALLDETERFEQIYQINPNGRVSVSNVNGSITVEAWDNPQVKLEAVKISDLRESLAEVEIKVDARADSFSVEAVYNNGNDRRGDKNWKIYKKLEVQFRLMVPRTAVLDEIETVNGSATVSNFTNYTKVSAVNGQVTATNLRGSASLETVNGTVEADFDSLETGSKISLSTVNGRVNLRIPSDSNATIKADTVNGNISNDFGLPVRKGKYVGKDLYGRIGSGDVQIKLESVNGGLNVNRKNDGKSPSQPTNLLNDKNKDDNDWNSEGFMNPPAPPAPPVPPIASGRVNTAQMNKDIAKSLKDSQKDVAEALKLAQKELDAMEPEIDAATREATRTALEQLKNLKPEELEAQLKLAENARKDAMKALGNMNFNFAFSAPSIEKKSETFQVKGTPKVTIDAKKCDVSVRGWDKPEVMYVVKKFARGRSESKFETKAAQNDSDVKITVAGSQISPATENYYEGENNVRIEVYVPKKSNLRIISDGEIRLENVSGEIDLDGDDESINIRDVDGKLKLTAADARVRIIGFRGELDSNIDDGEVYLEGDFSKIAARAVDGSYILTLPENADAAFRSNTDVEGDGFKLVKADNQTWRTGKGGENFNFQFTDGKLIVRNRNLIGKN